MTLPELFFFGPVRVKHAGEEREISLSKGKALLAYLMVTARPHSRERLAAMLWPESDGSRARASLRRVLYHLNQNAGEELLVTTGDTIGRNPHAALWVDVEVFRQRVAPCLDVENSLTDACVKDLEEAAALCQGEFLAGFTLPDSPGFDEWQFFEREALRSDLARVLMRLAEAYEMANNWDAAIRASRRWLALDPLHEPAHRHLMQLYALSGQQAAAVRQHEECVRILDEELGVEPEAETIALFEQIRSRQFAPGAVAAAPRNPRAGSVGRVHDGRQNASLSTGKGSGGETLLDVHLPALTSSFVGRQREMEEITELVQSSRLVTLTGPGGSGKTRLALQTGAGLAGSFSDGITFIPLASLGDPALLGTHIGRELGIGETPDRPVKETLIQALARRQLLLILDNFEHLLDAAPLIADLLAAIPGLTVLATSREPLRLYGEQEYQVPPLTLPDSADLLQGERIAENEAVALFVQRAQAVHPAFQLDAETAPIVADICIRLDGLPLAIELATIQLKLFSPQQLRKRLGDRLDTLQGGPRDVPERQKTLRNTIAWSYQLLKPSERQLFAMLSAFRGGWTLAAAEQICQSDGPSDIVDDLSGLLNKSLVQRSDGHGAETRFTMLETIREYATEQLIAAGIRPAIRGRHAVYYREVVQQADRPLRGGPHLETWLATLEQEHDNIRAALHWSLGGGDIETGLRLVGGLGHFWFRAGYHKEGRRWTLVALEKSKGAAEPLRAAVTMAAGRVAFATHRRAEGKRLDREALALYRRLGDRYHTACALCYLASDAIGEPDQYEAAIALCEEGVAIFEALDDQPGVAQGLNIIGELARLQGDLERARAVYEACLTIAQALGDRMRQVMMYQNLGTILERLGDYQRAQSLLEEALHLSVRRNDKGQIATSLAFLAGVTPAGPERAARLIGAADALFAEIGIIPMIGDKPEHDRIVERVRRELDEATFAALVAEGEALSWEEAVQYALQEEPVL